MSRIYLRRISKQFVENDCILLQLNKNVFTLLSVLTCTGVQSKDLLSQVKLVTTR